MDDRSNEVRRRKMATTARLLAPHAGDNPEPNALYQSKQVTGEKVTVRLQGDGGAGMLGVPAFSTRTHGPAGHRRRVKMRVDRTEAISIFRARWVVFEMDRLHWLTARCWPPMMATKSVLWRDGFRCGHL